MIVTRLMCRPKVRPAEKPAGFARCAKCVTKKRCVAAGECLHGKKAKGKQNG